MFSPDRFGENKSSLPLQEQNKTPSVQEQANFKGNYSELLFSRLHHPAIRNQLLDMLENNEKWIAEHPDDKTELKKDLQTGEVILDDLGLPLFEKVPGVYIPKNREQLNQEIEEGIAVEMNQTSIDFDKSLIESVATVINSEEVDSPVNRVAIMGMKRGDSSPLSEEEIQQRSMFEAHEKGHVFRKLKPSQYLQERFSQAFDLSNINLETYIPEGRPEGVTDEQIKESVEDYFNLSDPHEFIERMSQLKGYFGMKGDEKFTPQHLEHAREHYLEDIKFDNNMKAFFQAITPETEYAFLKLINSVGV